MPAKLNNSGLEYPCETPYWSLIFPFHAHPVFQGDKP